MPPTNPVASVIESLCAYFLTVPATDLDSARRHAAAFIRVHNDKLKATGEFSFPIGLDAWRSNLCMRANCIVRQDSFATFGQPHDEVTEAACRKFLLHTSGWQYPVEDLQVQGERCALFMQREPIIDRLLKQVLSVEHGPSYGYARKNPLKKIALVRPTNPNEKPNDLSIYRTKLIRDTVWRLIAYSEWTEVPKPEVTSLGHTQVLQLQVLSVGQRKSSETRKYNRFKTKSESNVFCGLVTDPLTGKMAKMEASEYQVCRSLDMRLMALHKYGIRVKDDARFTALMDRLGTAAVTVDLMEVRPSSPVQIIRSGQGSTRGASFILYNSARIETLLRTFDERVENGTYAPLPEIDAVDLSLLKEEEEWQLVFSYIFCFPNLIERCLENIENGICSTHLIVRFLSNFVATFSVYYRRVRILTETRDHLMPYLYARIYLVKAVREILNKTLALLDIEPVLFM